MKPFKPPSPLATNSLIGLCVAVQAGLMLGGPGFADAVISFYGLVPLRISQALTGVTPLSSLLPGAITHIFLHAGLVHLALNMVFLAWVGRYVEWVAGKLGIIGIFVIGASGGISAVFGAYAMMFATSRASARRILGVTISSEVLTALWYAASWIGLQLLVGYAFSSGQGPSIAIWTHVGGFLAGLIFARRYGRGPSPF